MWRFLPQCIGISFRRSFKEQALRRQSDSKLMIKSTFKILKTNFKMQDFLRLYEEQLSNSWYSHRMGLWSNKRESGCLIKTRKKVKRKQRSYLMEIDQHQSKKRLRRLHKRLLTKMKRNIEKLESLNLCLFTLQKISNLIQLILLLNRILKLSEQLSQTLRRYTQQKLSIQLKASSRTLLNEDRAIQEQCTQWSTKTKIVRSWKNALTNWRLNHEANQEA